MNENEFRDRVAATLRNAARKRQLVDHVCILLPEIEAFRMDGVPWLFIATILHQIRHGTDLSAEAQERYCGQVRKAYSKGRRKSHEAIGGRDPPASLPRLIPTSTASQSLNDRLAHRAAGLKPKER